VLGIKLQEEKRAINPDGPGIRYPLLWRYCSVEDDCRGVSVLQHLFRSIDIIIELEEFIHSGKAEEFLDVPARAA